MTHGGNDGPICALTDLPQAWCDHCRDDPAKGGRIRRSRPRGTEVRARFTARYPGKCTACGDAFAEGDRIGITIDEDYVCEECG